ncbi:MAG: ribbon-helix-helix protein, CopG family [Kiritimatiellae bacterium]|nr:ribbon-helix-helix protein, CopG family [Kiritimatiellia bacterium]
MTQKKGSATPVRLTEDEKNNLTKIAEETGLTSSTIIRLLIEALVKDYHENDNTMTLPLSWKRLSEKLDD